MQDTSRTSAATSNKRGESSGVCFVTEMKGLLLIAEHVMPSAIASKRVLAFCDSACSHSWISENVATKLKVKGKPQKLTVNGINSQEVIDTQTVKLKPVNPSGSCSTFDVTPFVRKNINVGSEVIHIDHLKTHNTLT